MRAHQHLSSTINPIMSGIYRLNGDFLGDMRTLWVSENIITVYGREQNEGALFRERIRRAALTSTNN